MFSTLFRFRDICVETYDNIVCVCVCVCVCVGFLVYVSGLGGFRLYVQICKVLNHGVTLGGLGAVLTW